MKEFLIDLFTANPAFGVFLSIALNIIISILGVVPSIFLTAANLAVFGFWEGTLLSFAGEAAGAVISFLLYRKGFKRATEAKLSSAHPKVLKLLNTEGANAFILILSLRLMPFVPSGLVTFVAAVGKTSLLVFIAASSIGKIPALLLEAYTAYQVVQWTWQGKLLTAAMAMILLIFVWYRLRSRKEL